MPSQTTETYRELTPDDPVAMRELLNVFSDAFDDPKHYKSSQPGDAYLRRLLGNETFVVIVAEDAGEIVGGLAAYELIKFEQERSEIYIYDIAVAADYRRRGVATALIKRLQRVAAERGAYVVFVQADIDDPPAIALYTKLGTREDVLHFDIDVSQRDKLA